MTSLFAIVFAFSLSPAAQQLESGDDPCVNDSAFSLSAEQLDSALAEHAKWLAGSGSGKRAMLCRVQLRGVNLQGRDLRRADLRYAALSGANLSDAKLDAARLQYADLASAKLTGARLNETNLYRAVLNDSDLTRVVGVGAKLRKTSMQRSTAVDADLRDTDIGKASLVEANFTRSDLRGATLRKSDLSSAIFIGARLQGANLRKVSFSDADFSNSELAEADLRGANLGSAKFGGADITGVRGLEHHDYVALRDRADSTGTNIDAALTKGRATPEPVMPSTTKESKPPLVAAPVNKPAEENAMASAKATMEAPTASMESGAETGSGYRVQLGSFRDRRVAESVSKRLETELGVATKGRGLLVESAEVRGSTWHRVQTRGFASASSARSFCNDVRDSRPSQGCIVVKR